jgi:DNA-binding transcriptional regulator GbsR (MarR family)
LSRAQKIENENIEVEEEVLKLHCENNHRKTIKELLENKGILLGNEKIAKMLENCEVC